MGGGDDDAVDGLCAEVAGGPAGGEDHRDVGERNLRAAGDADPEGGGSFELEGGWASVAGEDLRLAGNNDDRACGCRVVGGAVAGVGSEGPVHEDVVGVGAAVGKRDGGIELGGCGHAVVRGLHVEDDGEVGGGGPAVDVEGPGATHFIGTAGDGGGAVVVDEAGETVGMVLGVGGPEGECDDHEDAERKEKSGGEGAIRNTRHGNSPVCGAERG